MMNIVIVLKSKAKFWCIARNCTWGPILYIIYLNELLYINVYVDILSFTDNTIMHLQKKILINYVGKYR